MTKNTEKRINNKVSKNDDLNNEFTGNNNDIIKNMVLENNGVNIGSNNEILMGVKCDNEMLVYINKSERKWRKSIQVEELLGVNFSRNVAVGGEEKASHVFRKDESSFSVYLEDKKSANNCPWIFCAPDRWCENKVVVSPAYIERENVIWGYDG